MYQLFTHCLPTIIRVMLMSIVFFYFILAVFIWVFFLLVLCSSDICLVYHVKTKSKLHMR